MTVERETRYFVRTNDDCNEYIAHENKLTINQGAFADPKFADLVMYLRKHVEIICQSDPGYELDRITVILDYGVTNSRSNE
jgi:hypothetical protein